MGSFDINRAVRAYKFIALVISALFPGNVNFEKCPILDWFSQNIEG